MSAVPIPEIRRHTAPDLFGWLPFDPLAEHVGPRWSRDDHKKRRPLSTRAGMLDAIGLRRDTKDGMRWEQRFRRADQIGWIRLEDAEDCCFALGVHPVAIWGDTYFAAAPTVEWEHGGTRFCGRQDEWQSVGHERHYGLYD